METEAKPAPATGHSANHGRLILGALVEIDGVKLIVAENSARAVKFVRKEGTPSGKLKAGFRFSLDGIPLEVQGIGRQFMVARLMGGRRLVREPLRSARAVAG